MHNHLKSKLIQPYHQKYLPSTHISYQQNPAAKRSPNQHPSGTISGGLTQLTLMTESPIPKQNNSPHPATTNPNPIQPTETNVGKTIKGKCHALEKTQTANNCCQKKLHKMWELRDCKEVPKAFQINIKIDIPGDQPH